MIWRDILYNSVFPDFSVIAALARTFSIDAQSINISENFEDISNSPLFCLKSVRSGGQFDVVLTLYHNLEIADDNEMLSRIARFLGGDILASDDESSDPYAMILFAPSGNIDKVYVNADDLDNQDIYNLNSRPVGDDKDRYREGVEAGSLCPAAGFWFTPAKLESRRYFEAGDIMPEVASDYGRTIWQWVGD
jgi:hypothetical protein